MSDKSELVKWIQKYAQGIPTRSHGPKGVDPSVSTQREQPTSLQKGNFDIPKRHAPATSAPVSNDPNFVGPTQAPSANVPTTRRLRSDPDVLKMQEVLINLSKDVTSQLNLQDLAGNDPRKQQEAAGRDSFGSFITKHYLRTSEVPGVEFDPDPNKKNMDEKKPGQPTRLSVVMDTMKRIGDPVKGEQFADGVWGPRTNAALNNAYAFTQAMLKLAKDFKLPIQSYKEQFLSEFKENIPKDKDAKDFNPIQKNEAAKTITNHLETIRKMYDEVKSGILEKPQYRAFIEGDKPFVSYEKKGVNLTPEQLASLEQTFAQGFNVPLNNKGDNAKIEVKDLVSKEALDKWIKQFPQAQLDPQNILTSITNQLAPQNKGV